LEIYIKNTNMHNGSKGLGIRVLGLNSGFLRIVDKKVCHFSFPKYVI